MGKLLSWVALIALAWFALKLVAISQRRREQARSDAAHTGTRVGGGSAAGSEVASSERIVPCAHCGLFLPASDALRDGDSAYCSRAHLDAHRAQQRASQRGE